MKKSFLDSLVGKALDKAIAEVLLNGHKVVTLNENDPVASPAFSNTVMLFHNTNGIITEASPSDACEILD